MRRYVLAVALALTGCHDAVDWATCATVRTECYSTRVRLAMLRDRGLLHACATLLEACAQGHAPTPFSVAGPAPGPERQP